LFVIIFPRKQKVIHVKRLKRVDVAAAKGTLGHQSARELPQRGGG